jgi:hypothetical protein
MKTVKVKDHPVKDSLGELKRIFLNVSKKRE